MTTLRPYTSDEIKAAGSNKPDRGVFCPRCNNHIPEFADLSTEDVAQLRKLPPIEAMRTLRERTGCSLTWAKIWAVHPDGPHKAEPDAVPCPYCDLPLNARAKQCPLCKMDWHNPNETVRRGESLVDVILNAEDGSTIRVNGRFAFEAASLYADLKRPDAGLLFEMRPTETK